MSAFVRSQVVLNFSAFFTYAKTWFGIVLSAGVWVGFGVVSRTSAKAGSSNRGSRCLEDLLRSLVSRGCLEDLG